MQKKLQKQQSSLEQEVKNLFGDIVSRSTKVLKEDYDSIFRQSIIPKHLLVRVYGSYIEKVVFILSERFGFDGICEFIVERCFDKWIRKAR